jgi:hypothetical protein
MIDARVVRVEVDRDANHPDGYGRLILADRPGARPGSSGQDWLWFGWAPGRVGDLAGLDVWGGMDFLALGRIVIADRVAFAGIAFRDDYAIDMAITHYRNRERSC